MVASETHSPGVPVDSGARAAEPDGWGRAWFRPWLGRSGGYGAEAEGTVGGGAEGFEGIEGGEDGVGILEDEGTAAMKERCAGRGRDRRFP